MPALFFPSSQYFANISERAFTEYALDTFRYQAANVPVYREFIHALKIDPRTIARLVDIPFLPVSFFRSHLVATGTPSGETLLFESSTTTGQTPSRHYVMQPEWYHESLMLGFEAAYGDPAGYAIVALLPSYLERQHASLVYMVQYLIQKSGHPANAFFLYNHEQLRDRLVVLESEKQPTLLIGVTFALLDFATAYPMQLTHTYVMETGGMKGRRVEWTRSQVHDWLKHRLGVAQVHSEYGMTEMLSQAYAPADGIFYCSPTMKVFVRDAQDPLTTCEAGSGMLQIIDLANRYSCSFIASEDVGRVYPDGRFEVLGRADFSALRGCSLMAVS